MEIVLNDNANKKNFGSLSTGQVFIYDGNYFMKTEEAYDGTFKVNAVYLKDGFLSGLKDDDVVELVYCKLVTC